MLGFNYATCFPKVADNESTSIFFPCLLSKQGNYVKLYWKIRRISKHKETVFDTSDCIMHILRCFNCYHYMLIFLQTYASSLLLSHLPARTLRREMTIYDYGRIVTVIALCVIAYRYTRLREIWWFVCCHEMFLQESYRIIRVYAWVKNKYAVSGLQFKPITAKRLRQEDSGRLARIIKIVNDIARILTHEVRRLSI